MDGAGPAKKAGRQPIRGAARRGERAESSGVEWSGGERQKGKQREIKGKKRDAGECGRPDALRTIDDDRKIRLDSSIVRIPIPIRRSFKWCVCVYKVSSL